MNSCQDCVLLLSNEHEFFFVGINKKSNKKRMYIALDLCCATVSVMMPLSKNPN